MPTDGSGAPLATVCIPTFNAEPWLNDLLLALQQQQTDFAFEVLVIDSGSKDGTVDILKRSDVRLIEIPNSEFGHGRTRNLGAAEARGDFVAFLTQDAIPATNRWLHHLVAAFDLDPGVGAVYGPHIPRPDADPKTDRDQREFFAGMGPSDRPTIQRAGDITFFSDVNSCLRKETWKRVPFRDLPYSEDQALGKDVLEAGFLKVFEPRAAVVHSHHFPVGQYFRRMFDEWRGIKAAIGASFTPRLRSALKLAYLATRRDLGYIRRLNEPLSRRARWIGRATAMNLAREVTAYLVENEQRLPDALKDRLSHERHVRKRAA